MSDNPNFIATWSTNEIYVGEYVDECLTDLLDEMQNEITNKADLDHIHSGYATLSDLEILQDEVDEKADLSHVHAEYASIIHEHDEYAEVNHLHDEYALYSHNHDMYSPLNHNHDEKYALINHVHDNYATISLVDELAEAMANKADSSHSHNDVYYTEAEVDSKLANKSDTNHNHNGAYDAIGAANASLTNAKAYTDEKIEDVQSKIDAIIGEGAIETLNTIGELSDAIMENESILDALNDAIGSKANASDLISHKNNTSNPHNVTASQLGLGNVNNTSDANKPISTATQTALNAKAPTSHSSADATYGLGTNAKFGHVKLSDSVNSTSSINDGIAATPTAVKTAYDLANTAKVNANTAQVTADSKIGSVSLASGTNNGTLKLTVDGTSTDNIAVKGLGTAAYTNSDMYAAATHGTHVSYGTTSTAVGSTASAGSANTVSRSDHAHSLSKDAVVTALGYTPPTTNTTYNNATTSTAGLMSASDKAKLNDIEDGANKYTLPTASSSTLGGVKTTSNVTSTSGLTACPIISGVPYYKDTTYSLSSFGVTSTASELNVLDGITSTTTELNYCDGVTSNIQTQLNGKASSSHNHALSNINSGSITIGNKSKTLSGSSDISWTLSEIGADPLITGYYGSDVSGTAGWYKVCTVSQTGYSDFSLNLMVTSGYGAINSGILHLHTRCDNGTAITVKAIKWLVRYGWNADDAIIVTGNNTWSLYIYRETSQHGRMQVKVLSKTGTSTDTSFELTSNTTVETTTPSGTVSTDGGIVGKASSSTSAESAAKLATSAGSSTQPIYFSDGKPVATTYALNKTVPSDAKFTDTTYSAGTGISLSGTTINNSGVRSISTGSSNGTISVNTNGTSANVAVKGLGSAAYTASSAYLGSSGDQTLTDGAIIIPNASVSNSFRAKRTVDNVVSQADLYISENGNPRLRFNSADSTVNYLSLQSDSTVLGKPLALGSGGTGATTAASARSNLGITCTSLYSGTLSSGSCSFTYGNHKAYVVIGKPSTSSYGIVSLFIPASFITSKRTMQLADNLYYMLFDIVGSGTTVTITIGTNNNSGHIMQVYGVN